MTIQRLRDYDFQFLGGAPVVFHCHHFNLFLDQTIDDALGKAGAELRRLAARRASAELLSAICSDDMTPVERVETAKQTFAAMGHGALALNVSPTGGEAASQTLHYGLAWREKYGSVVKRSTPADGFGAGYSAAATGVAFGLPGETFDSREAECVAMRNQQCKFAIEPNSTPFAQKPVVDTASTQSVLGPVGTSMHEDVIAAVANGLVQFLAGVKPDERGLVQAFGVYVTLHLASYYNRISFDALEQIAQRDEELVGAFEDLLRESGHVCVFNTIGGILRSPEWEGLVEKPTDDPEQIATWSLAICRALGFGRWSMEAFTPGKEMVLTSPATYESVYFRITQGTAASSPEYFFQGAAAAIMQLAHHVKWSEGPQFTPDEYAKLFSNDEIPWTIEQTDSAALGDAQSRVVIRAR